MDHHSPVDFILVSRLRAGRSIGMKSLCTDHRGDRHHDAQTDCRSGGDTLAMRDGVLISTVIRASRSPSICPGATEGTSRRAGAGSSALVSAILRIPSHMRNWSRSRAEDSSFVLGTTETIRTTAVSGSVGCGSSPRPALYVYFSKSRDANMGFSIRWNRSASLLGRLWTHAFFHPSWRRAAVTSHPIRYIARRPTNAPRGDKPAALSRGSLRTQVHVPLSKLADCRAPMTNQAHDGSCS